MDAHQLDLDDIRARLDVVDRDQVAVLAERSGLMGYVVHYKRAHRMAIVDRAREDRMLDAIEDAAQAAHLDPRITRPVLRAIIDACTLLAVEELGPTHP